MRKKKLLLYTTMLTLSFALLTACGQKEPHDNTPTKQTMEQDSSTNEFGSEPEATTKNEEDTSVQESTTNEPEGTTVAPEPTTKVPETTKTPETTKEPEATTKKPETTTKAPETTKKPEATTKKPETTTKKPEPTTQGVPEDYSDNAIYDYNHPYMKNHLQAGRQYPTDDPMYDYSKAPVVDVDSMLKAECFGPNCARFDDVNSTEWEYCYDKVDESKYLTWNKDIPMFQYIIWGDKLGFFSHSNRNEAEKAQFKKLYTTDFGIACDEGKSGSIRIGSNTSWNEQGWDYYFTYITDWKK